MKVTIVALFLMVSASLAFGQSGGAVLNAQPSLLTLPSHPAQATYKSLALERVLTEKSAYTFAHGERPLWEVAPVSEEVPLGDIARALRDEHLKAPKAQFVKEN
jgi:hypothetical protein